METIELNPQAKDWLVEHLEQELKMSDVVGYSEMSKGIIRYLLVKLNKSNEQNEG
jgi:hypothetical protein